jgi:hypothetical protein
VEGNVPNSASSNQTQMNMSPDSELAAEYLSEHESWQVEREQESEIIKRPHSSAIPEHVSSTKTYQSPAFGGSGVDQILRTIPSTASSDTLFWHKLLVSYHTVRFRYASWINVKMREGIPDHLRGLIWHSMCKAPPSSSSHQSDLEANTFPPTDGTLQAIYASLREKTSPYENAIMKDIPRTFPECDQFRQAGEMGQQQLFHVVKAYSLYNGEIGYCQGITFVVASLLRKVTLHFQSTGLVN